MQYLKLVDKITWHEITGHEDVRPNRETVLNQEIVFEKIKDIS